MGAWAAAPGGRGSGLPNFSAFNVMPMGGAWKESTLNGPRPPSRRAVAPPLDGGDESRPFLGKRLAPR